MVDPSSSFGLCEPGSVMKTPGYNRNLSVVFPVVALKIRTQFLLTEQSASVTTACPRREVWTVEDEVLCVLCGPCSFQVCSCRGRPVGMWRAPASLI